MNDRGGTVRDVLTKTDRIAELVKNYWGSLFKRHRIVPPTDSFNVAPV